MKNLNQILLLWGGCLWLLVLLKERTWGGGRIWEEIYLAKQTLQREIRLGYPKVVRGSPGDAVLHIPKTILMNVCEISGIFMGWWNSMPSLIVMDWISIPCRLSRIVYKIRSYQCHKAHDDVWENARGLRIWWRVNKITAVSRVFKHKGACWPSRDTLANIQLLCSFVTSHLILHLPWLNTQWAIFCSPYQKSLYHIPKGLSGKKKKKRKRILSLVFQLNKMCLNVSSWGLVDSSVVKHVPIISLWVQSPESQTEHWKQIDASCSCRELLMWRSP